MYLRSDESVVIRLMLGIKYSLLGIFIGSLMGVNVAQGQTICGYDTTGSDPVSLVTPIGSLDVDSVHFFTTAGAPWLWETMPSVSSGQTEAVTIDGGTVDVAGENLSGTQRLGVSLVICSPIKGLFRDDRRGPTQINFSAQGIEVISQGVSIDFVPKSLGALGVRVKRASPSVVVNLVEVTVEGGIFFGSFESGTLADWSSSSNNR